MVQKQLLDSLIKTTDDYSYIQLLMQ